MRNLLLALMLSGAVSLGACANEKPDATIDASGMHAAVFVAPAITGETATIRIRMRGTPAEEIVAATYGMPDMPMAAPGHVAVNKVADGYESAPLRFSMGGTWRITLLAKRGSGQTALTSFDVQVR